MSFLVPSRRVAALAAAGTGLAAVLAGAFTPAAHAADTPTASASAKASDWFVDPRTPAQRKAQLAVPKKPKAYSGKVRETRAVYRTKAGDLAVPMRYAFGHQVEEGQAVTLDGEGLFVVNTVKLTSAARTQLTRLAGSFENAARVRCEGYADYAGAAARNKTLAAGRATAVCDFLGKALPGLRTATASYGPSWPAVVGGTSEDRRLNRRVVVEMFATRPTAPQFQVPGAPTLVDTHGSIGRIRYGFTVPTTDGGTPITGYEVSTGSGWTPVEYDDPTRRRAGCFEPCFDGLRGILRDLPAGVVQNLRVRAVNKVGAGAPSNTLSDSAVGYPGVPTDLEVVGTDHTLTVTFGAPETDGGNPIYAYEISYDGGQNWEFVTSVSTEGWTVVKEDLENGVVYDVQVRAWNGYGPGEPATGSDRVATVPDAPVLTEDPIDVMIEDGVPLAWFVFFAPDSRELDLEQRGSDGGADIEDYEITFDGGLTWAELDYESIGETPADGVYGVVLDDLTIGDLYKFSIRAVNEKGASQPTETRTFTPVDRPGSPTDVVATVDGTTVTVTFTAPAYDGGAELGYEVRVDGGEWEPAVLDLSGTTITLTDQTPGSHSYAVRAVNSAGHSGGTSSDYVDVEELAVPDAPSIRYVAYNGTPQTWEIGFTPGATNGATVTGYQVSYGGGAWANVSGVFTNSGGSVAQVACSGGSCGFSYSGAFRLRAVTASGFSPESSPYEYDPI